MGFVSEPESHASPLADILGKTVNFLILFGGLSFLLAKPLRKFLAEIGLSVEKTIRETERARTEAVDRLESLKKRMESLEEEIRDIKTEAEEAGNRERERALALARRESEKIRLLAAQEIEILAQAAKAELRAHAADIAVSLARANLERRLTPEAHSRFIDDSIRNLEALDEKFHSR